MKMKYIITLSQIHHWFYNVIIKKGYNNRKFIVTDDSSGQQSYPTSLTTTHR